MRIIGWNWLSVVSAFRQTEISQRFDQYNVIPFAGTQSNAATGILANKYYPPKVTQPRDFTKYRATVKQLTIRASDILQDVPSRCTPTLYADVNDDMEEQSADLLWATTLSAALWQKQVAAFVGF